MKTITIERENRTLTFNPLFVKEVILIRNEINSNWCISVVHVINNREVAETILFNNHAEAQKLYEEYKSCLESI